MDIRGFRVRDADHFPGTNPYDPPTSRFKIPLSASSSHTSRVNPAGGMIDTIVFRDPVSGECPSRESSSS